jgi:hypothetical protein
LLLLASRPIQCPHTPRCWFQSLSSDTRKPPAVSVLRHPDATCTVSSDTPMPPALCPQTPRCHLQSVSSETPMPPAVSVLRHPDASSSQSKPHNLLPNRYGSLLGPRLRFLVFSGALLPNLNKTAERELPRRESLAARTYVCCRTYELTRLA